MADCVDRLNVEDVDVEARRIRVRRSITQVGGRLVEGNPKSDAGRRSVPIPERLVPALKARLDNRQPGAPAITSPRGSRLGLENWKRSVDWKAAITKLGRDKMRVHDLRHTYASLLIAQGAHPKLISEQLGHALLHMPRKLGHLNPAVVVRIAVMERFDQRVRKHAVAFVIFISRFPGRCCRQYIPAAISMARRCPRYSDGR